MEVSYGNPHGEQTHGRPAASIQTNMLYEEVKGELVAIVSFITFLQPDSFSSSHPRRKKATSGNVTIANTSPCFLVRHVNLKLQAESDVTDTT